MTEDFSSGYGNPNDGNANAGAYGGQGGNDRGPYYYAGGQDQQNPNQPYQDPNRRQGFH
jgi:hypothetical protein